MNNKMVYVPIPAQPDGTYDEMLTIDEMARLLKTTYGTVRSMVIDGRIPSIALSPKSGKKHYRIPRAAALKALGLDK